MISRHVNRSADEYGGSVAVATSKRALEVAMIFFAKAGQSIVNDNIIFGQRLIEAL